MIKTQEIKSNAQKIILVTGCAGFIGSHIAEELLKRGDKVIGVDEINDYYDVKQKEKNIQILKEYPNFSFHKLDFTKKNEMHEIFKKNNIEYIAHLGARAGVRPSIENPYLYVHSNVLGTLTLLELAKEFKIKNFILTSSSSVYGNQTKIPFSETDDVSKAISPYAATKKACEVMGYTYHHLYKLNVTCIRPFTIYGPRGRPDMAPFMFVDLINNGKQIKKFGDGTSKRDYTYISDFVKGFISALDKPLGYEIINLGNNSPVSLNEFISTIEKITNKKAIITQLPMQPGDVDITYADISKAKKLLGYEPKTTIEEGLRKFYEWYNKK